MALTQNQLRENDKFFSKMAAMSKSYLWPDMGLFYNIVDGNFICPTKRHYDVLKSNTSKSFHGRIKRT